MKMIVSDYDETFYINDEDIKRNVEVIKEFMRENIFVIATGKSYLDFYRVKEKYHIECNYLIINHGATILKDDQILANKAIDNRVKEELVNLLDLHDQDSMFCCSGKESRVSVKTDHLTKIHIRFDSLTRAHEVRELLKQKYADSIKSFITLKDKALEIVSSDTNKASSIYELAKLEGVPKDSIYTIGDNYNDLEMIQEFHGTCVKDSVDEIKRVALKEYNSVSELVLDVLNNE